MQVTNKKEFYLHHLIKISLQLKNSHWVPTDTPSIIKDKFTLYYIYYVCHTIHDKHNLS